MKEGLLFEVFGEPGVGKSHQAHANFPDAATIDTAGTEMGFRELEVKDRGNKGETWDVIRKIYDWGIEEAEKHYWYATDFDEVYNAMSMLKDDHKTIVLDNAADLRALAAKKYCEKNNKEWPQQQEWGKVNDMIDEFIEETVRGHKTNLVVVSQMKDEYKNDTKTGRRIRDGPKRLPYKADIRAKVVINETESGKERKVKILKNRFVDKTGENWFTDLDELDYELIMTLSQVPEKVWRE